MSIETANQFYQVVMQDPNLKQEFQTAAESKSNPEILQMAVEQGQKYGYNFTVEEVAQVIVAAQRSTETDGNAELSDQQLEVVAGGEEKLLYSYTGVNVGQQDLGDYSYPL